MTEALTLPRVLIVDDDAAILRGIEKALRRYRQTWDLVFALGGPAGLEQVRLGTFDVVVSDIRMPEVDGAELLGHVRDRDPTTIRIVLSGTQSPPGPRPIAHRFLDKPCNLNRLSTTIERGCALRAIFRSDSVRAVVDRYTMRPPPAVYDELSDLLDRGKASPAALAELLADEPELGAQVLALALSPVFEGVPRMTSIAGAAAALGVEMVTGLVLLAHAAAACPASVAVEELQQHALRIAERARGCAPDRQTATQAFTAGLVHQIGELTIGTAVPEAHATIERAVAQGGATRSRVERDVLGTTCAELSAYQLAGWGFAMSIVEAVAWYADDDVPATPVSTALRAAHF